MAANMAENMAVRGIVTFNHHDRNQGNDTMYLRYMLKNRSGEILKAMRHLTGPLLRGGLLATFVLALAACALVPEEGEAEGTAESPVILGGVTSANPTLTHEGEVVRDVGSYYQAAVEYDATTSTGYNHTVTLSDLGSDVDLYVYGVNGFGSSPPLCAKPAYGTADESCGFANDGTIIYILVKLAQGESATFTLTLQRN